MKMLFYAIKVLLYTALLSILIQLFALDNILASFISQVIYILILILTVFTLYFEKEEKKNKRSVPYLFFYVIIYIILISSWHINIFKYSISPDVLYENLIVSKIISEGSIGSPFDYYYAAKLYSEFPLLEILVAIFSKISSVNSLIVFKYLWTSIKTSLIISSFIFFKEVLIKDSKYIGTIQNYTWIISAATLISLANSSSVYFFSFSNHALFSVLFVVLYLHLMYKQNLILSVIMCTAIGLTHNATLYIFTLALLLWWLSSFIIIVFKNRSKKLYVDTSPIASRDIITLASIVILMTIILWKAQLNLRNIIINFIHSLILSGEPDIQASLSGSISPVKPVLYKVMGYLGEFALLIIFITNIRNFLNTLINSLTIRSPLSLLIFFGAFYAIGLYIFVIFMKTGIDVVVRGIFYLNFVISIFVANSISRQERIVKNKTISVIHAIIMFLFLLTGIYGIVPPAIYDKSIEWSMDDPRFFLHYGDTLWNLGDFIMNHNVNGRLKIMSIALGYYFLGGRGISFDSLCNIFDTFYNHQEHIVLLRRSIEIIPDYCNMILDLEPIYAKNLIIYNSNEIFLIFGSAETIIKQS